MASVERPTLPGAWKDISAGLSAPEARWLVDYYYAVQDYRIQATGQKRAVAQHADSASAELVTWIGDNMQDVENNIQKALNVYSSSHIAGVWAKSIFGIGPVISAGLLAHIDITRAPTVGNIWSFAGLNPSAVWAKGEKRPWNAKLKVLCWKIGDSFVKFHNKPACVYGHVYAERKAQEVQRNEAGLFADQAAHSLATRNIKDKDLRLCYESGKLPDGRIDLRARRYAVKLFLAHYHHVAYEVHYDEKPPKPYIIEHGGHTHFIAPPNWPLDQGGKVVKMKKKKKK